MPGAGLTLRPTAPSKLLLEDYSRNAFAVCSCGGVCWCGGSLRTGFPRGPEDAISTIPSRATPVLLAAALGLEGPSAAAHRARRRDTMVVAGVKDRVWGAMERKVRLATAVSGVSERPELARATDSGTAKRVASQQVAVLVARAVTVSPRLLDAPSGHLRDAGRGPPAYSWCSTTQSC